MLRAGLRPIRAAQVSPAGPRGLLVFPAPGALGPDAVHAGRTSAVAHQGHVPSLLSVRPRAGVRAGQPVRRQRAGQRGGLAAHSNEFQTSCVYDLNVGANKRGCSASHEPSGLRKPELQATAHLFALHARRIIFTRVLLKFLSFASGAVATAARVTSAASDQVNSLNNGKQRRASFEKFGSREIGRRAARTFARVAVTCARPALRALRSRRSSRALRPNAYRRRVAGDSVAEALDCGRS